MISPLKTQKQLYSSLYVTAVATALNPINPIYHSAIQFITELTRSPVT